MITHAISCNIADINSAIMCQAIVFTVAVDDLMKALLFPFTELPTYSASTFSFS